MQSNMKVFLFVVAFFVSKMCSGQNNATIDHVGEIHCSNGATISTSTLLNNRAINLPNTSYNSAIPSKCTGQVQAQVYDMIKGFRKEDENKLQSIANNFCSHQEGWVEIKPGECQAGGPPPVCVADHWTKSNRQDAMAAFAQQLRKLSLERAERVNSLKKRAEDNLCSCWVSEMKREDESQTLADVNQVTSGGDYSRGFNSKVTSSVKFPCMGGCPDGYTCEEGFCVQTDKRSESTYDKANEYLIEKGKGKVVDEAVGRGLEEVLKNMGGWGRRMLARGRYLSRYNLYYDVASNALDPTVISGGNETYMNKIADINSSAQRLEGHYSEYLRLRQGLNMVRDASLIKEDIIRERNTLGTQLYLLYGYRKEAGFSCKGCCDQILDYQLESVSKHVTRMMNFKIE